MGGSQSTRRIVVENQGGEGVVTVTEEVVRRLQGLPDEPYKSSKTSSEVPPRNFSATPENEHIENVARAKMKEIEEFYIEKLKDLQDRNADLQKQTNEHFATAVKEVEQKFMNFSTSPVCQDLQQKVMECYQANPHQTLNCSSIVSAFTACVDKARMVASANRLRNVS